MWWVEWSGLEFFSILGLPTICVLDRQDMLSSDLGLGNVFRLIRLFLGLFYWVHQSLQKRLMFVGGDFLYSLERESVMRLLFGSAHLLQERLEGNEAVVVGGVAELLHQVLGLLLGQLLTEVHQQLEQLELQDGVVGIFVVQLQDLNEVVEATLVLGVLAGLYMGKTSGLVRNFSPLATPPPISLMVFRVGFRLQARTRSPAWKASSLPSPLKS